jgi:hypothetical protein
MTHGRLNSNNGGWHHAVRTGFEQRFRIDRIRSIITPPFNRFLDLTSSALSAQSIYYYLVSSTRLLLRHYQLISRKVPHFGSLVPLGAITP